jgi:hypothetical protein
VIILAMAPARTAEASDCEAIADILVERLLGER